MFIIWLFIFVKFLSSFFLFISAVIPHLCQESFPSDDLQEQLWIANLCLNEKMQNDSVQIISC
jgi:hypothetical protein